MSTNAEFKFNCPTCGQHILVATDWVGLGMSCPSCQTKITIPSPSSGRPPEQSSAIPTPSKTTIRIELPPKSEQASVNSSGQSVGSTATVVAAPINVTGHEPWPELVQQLEKGALIEPSVMVAALFRELTCVRRRLESVERKLADQ